MTCDVPIRECLAWHYAPSLVQATTGRGGLTIRARCPACGGGRDSLSISAGEHLRTTWHCFAGCDGGDIRRALVVAGVPPGCLPPGNGTEHSRTDTVTAILRLGTRHDRAVTILRAYAILGGYTRWPRGLKLEGLAAEVGVSRRDAYRAASASPLLPPLTTSTKHASTGLVKRRRSGRRERSGEVPPTAQVPSPPGLLGATERRRER